MTPERQRDAFQVAQRKAAAGYETSSAFAGQDLATIGESLYCYVPRLLRHLGFEPLLTMSYFYCDVFVSTDLASLVSTQF